MGRLGLQCLTCTRSGLAMLYVLLLRCRCWACRDRCRPSRVELRMGAALCFRPTQLKVPLARVNADLRTKMRTWFAEMLSRGMGSTFSLQMPMSKSRCDTARMSPYSKHGQHRCATSSGKCILQSSKAEDAFLANMLLS